MAKDGKQYAKISGTWHQIKPSYDDLTDVPTDFNPTTHTHGNMNDDGQITASQNIATGDHLVIADHSANNDLTTSDITFDTSNTTQFLRRDGNFATPSSSDGTKLPLAGGTMTGDLTLDHDGTGTTADSHGVVFTARVANQDYTTELKVEGAGGLHFGTDEVYHEGHKPTYTELGTMAYSNLTGTPTIPTNNNQLTNGAGYISSFDITTQTDGKYLRSNANDDFSGTLNYTPDTGTILSVDGQAILQRMTANGAITIGHDDAVIIAGGDTSVTLNGNINNAVETVFVGAEGGFVAYAFPSNNTAWSNRKEMKWDGANLTLLGNNVLTTADEGSGNGLDADTLDGSHASTFAPLASPALTGNPTAPTATAGDNDTTIATTAFVSTAISNLVNGASASFDTLKEIQDAMATDTELSNAIAGLTIGNGTQTITAGTGLSGGGSFTANQTGNTSVTLNLDLSEFTDMTADVNGLQDEMILLDNGAERKKLLSEIKLTQFNNDAGWTSNTGDITGVTAGNGLTGGATSGNATLNVVGGTGITANADDIAISSQFSPRTALELPSSQDLNDLKGNQSGFYYQTSNADTSGNNYPIDVAGSLLVQKSAGQVTQTYITYQNPPRIYVRSYYTSWSSWVRVFEDNYHPNADTLTTARNIALTGDVTGSANFDGSSNISITATVADDSHNHTIANVDGLSASLANKVDTAGDTMTGDLTLDHDGSGTTADSHALKFRARAANTDFEREIKLEDGGGFAFNSNILLTGDVTTNNASRTIDFTGFDKEGTTDFSDRAYIQHTENTGGHTGSVLKISSRNDSNDGIAFDTHGSSQLKHNSNIIWDAGNDGSGSGLDADLLDGEQGSHYLDYNNFTNTPTIPTNNNQLTNGAGYVTTDTNTVTNLRANSGTYRNGNLSLVNGSNVTITETSTGVFSIAATDTNTNTQLSNEQVQDIVGGMVTGNSETGISVTYQDADGTLDFALTKDPTITLNGDVSGAATMTDLNSVTISTTVANDSHTHDTRYYTESEMDTFLAGKAASSHTHDSRYYTETEVNNLLDDKRDANQTITLTGDVSGSGTTSIAVTINDDSHNHTISNIDNLQTTLNGKLSTTAAAAAVSYVTSCPTSTNSTGMKVYVGSTDCSTKYSGWLYLIT